MSEPKERSLLTVSWDAGRLALNSGRLGYASVDAPLCPPSDRYDVRLNRGWLVTKLNDGVAALQVGSQLDTLAFPMPESGMRSGLRERIADPTGAFLVLSNGALHVWRAETGWERYRLPGGMRVWCAALARDGTPWIGGALDPNHGAAIASAVVMRWIRGRFVPVRPHLGILDAMRAIVPNHFASINGIEVSGSPAVLWTEPADATSETACLFVADSADRWHAVGLGQMIRALHRTSPAHVLVVTPTGDLFQTQGHRLRRVAFAATLCSHALEGAPTNARALVRGSDAAGSEIAVVVGAYSAPADQPLLWHQTVALWSKDSGATWSREQATRPVDGQPELLDVALV